MATLIGVALAIVGLSGPASASFIAYNDTVGAGEPAANVTIYSGYLGGGGGFEDPTGLLKDFTTGLDTDVTATLTAVNVSGSLGSMPVSGTEAYNIFNGIVNLGGSASYGSSSVVWSYEVVFTGLDPTKTYEFVTTANREEGGDGVAYGGGGSSSRWTKFSLIGADTYTNDSSISVTEVSEDVLKMNTGYNTVLGYVIQWTGITAADGSFTVLSQNVGADGPGEAIKSYGMQAFRLTELDTQAANTVVPLPAALPLFAAALGGMGAFGWRRRRPTAIEQAGIVSRDGRAGSTP